MQSAMSCSSTPAHHHRRRGFAAVKELSVVVVMMCFLIWGLDGAQRAIKQLRPGDIDLPRSVHALAVDASGEALWLARMQSGVSCVSLPDLAEREVLPLRPVLCSVALSQSVGSTVFVSARLDGMVEIDVDGRRVIEQEVSPPDTCWNVVAASGDARVVVAATRDGALHRWIRHESGFHHDRQSLGFSVFRMSLDHAGYTLAVLSENSEIHIWDLQHAVAQSQWRPGDSFCSSISLAADGDRLATTGSNGRLCVWRVATGHKIWDQAADGLDPAGAAFSPCGRWLISGGFDNRVRLWDAATGRNLAEHMGHTRAARIFAWSADSRTTFSSGLDGRVHAWKVSGTGTALRPSNSID